MGDSPASYIRLVQHLIEKCIIFNMSKDECMEALFKHANIKPVITSTVWKELEKENKEFFEAYERSRGREKSGKWRRQIAKESRRCSRIQIIRVIPNQKILQPHHHLLKHNQITAQLLI